MGNNISKRSSKKGGGGSRRATKSMPPPTRPPPSEDNEYSVNTTQSVNSILLNSQHRQSLPPGGARPSSGTNSALAQLNPDYPTGDNKKETQQQSNEDEEQDTIQGQEEDPFGGKVAHPQQHKLLAASDFWPPQQGATAATSAQGSSNNRQSLGENDYNNQLTVGSINQLTVNSVASYNTSTVTPAEVDDYIDRLLNAGYSKITKQLCLKNSEVVAICRAAMEIFLSQPVSLNLSLFVFYVSSLYYFPTSTHIYIQINIVNLHTHIHIQVNFFYIINP